LSAECNAVLDKLLFF